MEREGRGEIFLHPADWCHDGDRGGEREREGGELDLTILPAGDMTEIGEKLREVEGGWSMTSPCCRLVT